MPTNIKDEGPGLMWISKSETDSDKWSISWTNRRVLEFTGTDSVGDVFPDLVHPDDRTAIVQQWDRARSVESDYDGFVRYRRSDGQYRWHFYRVRFAGGGRWYGTALDVHNAYLMKAFGSLSPKVVDQITRLRTIVNIAATICTASFLVAVAALIWGIVR